MISDTASSTTLRVLENGALKTATPAAPAAGRSIWLVPMQKAPSASRSGAAARARAVTVVFERMPSTATPGNRSSRSDSSMAEATCSTSNPAVFSSEAASGCTSSSSSARYGCPDGPGTGDSDLWGGHRAVPDRVPARSEPPFDGATRAGGANFCPAPRRRGGPAHDDAGVSEQPAGVADARERLLRVYDTALPQVYGYLLARCGTPSLAEDLTAETFLAAVATVRRDAAATVSVPWLVGVARHKLVDHWRASAREERGLRAVGADPTSTAHDPWDVQLDAMLATQTLARLGPHHRAALTLRYLDDLPVPQVAAALHRTVHATEALLVRARAAFRREYPGPATTRNGEEDGRD